MKLRAIIQDPQWIREFQNIIATLSKLTKDYCVIRFGKYHMQLIANQEYGTYAPLVWVDIDVKAYFHEYLMEPTSEDYPYIMLSFSAMDLGRALTTTTNANVSCCKLKLNMVQFPCLTLDSEGGVNSRSFKHNVPVDIVPCCDWPVYDLPRLPPLQLVLGVPSVRKIRSLIDKIKNFSPNIIFHGTSSGELSLVAEAEMITVAVRYRRLLIRAVNPSSDQREKSQTEASCSVDCRKASIFFNALQLPSEELSCGFNDENSIHIKIDVRDGVVVNSMLLAVCV